MSNININYRSALILKHALRRQLEYKENYMSMNEVDINFINDYNIEKKTYIDFSNKINEKFKNYIKNE